MISVCYRFQLLLGMCLLLACGEPHRTMPYSGLRSTEVGAKQLAKVGLTALDLINYHTASMTTILDIADLAGLKMKPLGRLSELDHRTLRLHMRGKYIMLNASLTKLQQALRQVVDDSEMEEHSKQYHHERIGSLPKLLMIERAVVTWHKM